MTTLIAFIFGPGGVYTILTALIGAALLYARKTGKDAVKAEQASEEAKARDVADQVENDVGALTPAQKREGLLKWAKD